MGPGMSDDAASTVMALIATVAIAAFGLGFLIHWLFF